MQKGLPNRFYTTREDFLLERERIFSSMWTCIGFASDTAEPGDAFPLEFMELPFSDSAGRGPSTACFS